MPAISNPVPSAIGYVIRQVSVGGSVASSPLDSTTYYIQEGESFPNGGTATKNIARHYIAKAGRIKAAFGALSVEGTLGSNEAITVAVRLNDTTNTVITDALTAEAVVNTFSNTALSVDVAAGDFIEFIVITPAWVTNPTAVRFNCSVYIE